MDVVEIGPKNYKGPFIYGGPNTLELARRAGAGGRHSRNTDRQMNNRPYPTFWKMNGPPPSGFSRGHGDD